MKKTLGFISTARSDYSIMMPLIKAALADNEFQCLIFCGGMHLKPEFGDTWRQFKKDGIKIDEKIEFYSSEDSAGALVDSLSSGLRDFGHVLLKHKVELLIVAGDRIENLSILAAATALSVPVCHLCGGDVSEGAIDNQVRHMMTKLSHLHMVALEDHRKRVVQMGEEAWRVSHTGNPALDLLKNYKPFSRKELLEIEGVPEFGDLLLCTFHPQTLGDDNYLEQFDVLLEWLMERSEITVLTYPNIDAGNLELRSRLEKINRKNIVLKKSFSPMGYYSMMAHAKIMIGNSSSGIWEAPSFKLPVINVGMRQQGRTRMSNVVDVRGLKKEEYDDAVALISTEEFQSEISSEENAYGGGSACEKILNKIKNTKLDSSLLVKKFVDCSC